MRLYTKEEIEMLRAGVAEEILTAEELISKTLEARGLEFAQMGSVPCSKPFVVQPITKELFEAMKEAGCVFRIVRDHLRIYNGNPTPTDEAMVSTVPWFFPGSEEVSLQLYAGFRVAFGERGLILYPGIINNRATVMDNALLRVFQAYAKTFPDTHPIVQEMVDGQGEVFVGWHEVGLGGTRSIGKLFVEFANKGVMELAHSTVSPFSFDPLGVNMPPGRRERYLPEPDQIILFTIWKWEQEQFKNRL